MAEALRCAQGHADYENSCDDCHTDFTAIKERLEEQAKKSEEIYRRLHDAGVPIPMTPLVQAAQIETLCEIVIEGKREKAVFEELVGAKVLGYLNDAQKSVHASTIHVPNQTKGLHVVRRHGS